MEKTNIEELSVKLELHSTAGFVSISGLSHARRKILGWNSGQMIYAQSDRTVAPSKTRLYSAVNDAWKISGVLFWIRGENGRLFCIWSAITGY